MTAREVFHQNNGDVTKQVYAEMNARGPRGQLAVALFRAQKRSTAAKSYRGRRFKRAAYDVKNWSMSEITRILVANPELGIKWGWGEDHGTPGYEWVLYVALTTGQCSFHASHRGDGPEFAGEWDGIRGASQERIIAFCDETEAPVFAAPIEQGEMFAESR